MKSKTLSYIVASLAIGSMLASCSSTSNQLSSSFGSRKYTKGYFYNTPATVGTIEANTTVKAITPAESVKPSVTEVVVKPTVAANTNVATTKAATEQTLPSTVVKKNTLRSLTAMAKTQAVAKVAAPANYFNTEKTAGVETVAQVQHGGGGGYFHEHPVRCIIIGVLVIAILLFFILTGGTSYNSRDGVQ
jgi:hypothetical protein